MKNLEKILSKTKLLKDENTKKILTRAIRKAFDETREREEAETLALLAYKYNLPCLDEMLNDLEVDPYFDF